MIRRSLFGRRILRVRLDCTVAHQLPPEDLVCVSINVIPCVHTVEREDAKPAVVRGYDTALLYRVSHIVRFMQIFSLIRLTNSKRVVLDSSFIDVKYRWDWKLCLAYRDFV